MNETEREFMLAIAGLLDEITRSPYLMPIDHETAQLLALCVHRFHRAWSEFR